MHWGRPLRAAATALTAVALAAVGLVATAGTANAADGLAETGKATYVVSDDGRPVRVTQTLTVTNQSPPTATRFFYWTEYALWLPNGASNVKATSRGSSMRVRTSTHDGQEYAELSFPSRLEYGQSRSITVTYSIPGAPPRSARPGRVGKGYAAIEVYSPGDAGRASIEIEAPRWMTIDVAEEFEESSRGDNRVATLTGGGPDGLWSLLSLRDPSQSLKSQVTVDDDTFDVVAFPGDTAWVAHIAKNLPPTLRELERLTGEDWPTAKTSISEDFSRLVYGWDGTYKGGDITVSEAIDPALLAHELSHAWANYDNFDQRWLTEGVAQALTTQVMAATKGKDQEHDEVKPTQEGAFPLAEWADTADASEAATEAEDYAYPASWRAVHALVSGSTKVSKPELFRALVSGRTVYDAPGDGGLITKATSWQQAYDLFEVTGGNPKTRSIMTTWVVGPEAASQLTARGTARKTYAAHEKLDGAWASPRGVRQAMAEWNFPAAQSHITQTAAMAKQAATVQAVATKAALDPKGVRTAYEQADSTDEYAEVATQLTALGRQATTYAELRTRVADANPLAALGGRVLLPAMHLDRAESALARGNSAAADRALKIADTTADLSAVTGGALILLVLLVLAGLVLRLRRRLRRRRAQAAPATWTSPAP